jgi:ATP-dependent Clp protease protease subunit
MREELNGILSGHTGQSLERIEKDTERELLHDCGEALEYGIIDSIMVKRGDAEKKA